MKTTTALCLLLVAMAAFVTGDLTDPCLAGNHRNMERVESRSTAYVMPASETARCDRRLRDAWYRVFSRAGEDMPTFCPPEGSCGTIYPIWMNGTVPMADGQVHDRLAALHVEGDCFFSTLSIQVKNCGDYRVYRLAASTACPAAYCFGQGSVCPSGQTSENGYTPCSNISASDTTTEMSPTDISSAGIENSMEPTDRTVTTSQLSKNQTDGIPTICGFFLKEVPWYMFVAISFIVVFSLVALCLVIRFLFKRNWESTAKVTPKDEPPAYCALPPPVSIYYGDLYFPAVETEGYVEKQLEKSKTNYDDKEVTKMIYKC